MSETAVKIGPGVVTGDGVQEVFERPETGSDYY